MIGIIVGLYNLLVLAYIVLQFVHVPANRWTELLNSLVEPALGIVRMVLKPILPEDRKGFDWCAVALFVILILVGVVLGLLSKIPLIGWLF